MSDDEIRTLLKGRTLLDGPSVRLLAERGLAAEAGVAEVTELTLAADGFAYERINSTRGEGFELEYPRMSAQRCAMRLMAIRAASASARELTTICRYDHRELCPGLLLVRTAGGGEALLSALAAGRRNSFTWVTSNNFRRVLIAECVAAVCAAAPSRPAKGCRSGLPLPDRDF